jgi:hypothetical protein
MISAAHGMSWGVDGDSARGSLNKTDAIARLDGLGGF